MLELPEAVVMAAQINQALKGKTIRRAQANHTPHKFAWYSGDPANYNALLAEKTIGEASSYGGHIEIKADDMVLVLSLGLRCHAAGEKPPAKHQLLLEFSDGAAASATVQMWGGLFCYREGEAGGYPDAAIARQRPSPLSDQFDRAVFDGLLTEECGKLSAKAFLATGQRIPGLGNGVLQDILWTAHVHPEAQDGHAGGGRPGDAVWRGEDSAGRNGRQRRAGYGARPVRARRRLRDHFEQEHRPPTLPGLRNADPKRGLPGRGDLLLRPLPTAERLNLKEHFL